MHQVGGQTSHSSNGSIHMNENVDWPNQTFYIIRNLALVSVFAVYQNWQTKRLHDNPETVKMPENSK